MSRSTRLPAPRSTLKFSPDPSRDVNGWRAAKLGDARGRDRDIRRLVALAPVWLGWQVRAVGLDHKAIRRDHPRHLRQGTRPGIRHGARQRDEEPEVETAARDLEIAREAVHDPAPLARALGREDRQRLLVGVAAVDEHRLPGPPRDRQLRTIRALLSLPRREVAGEVESG